jgi:hypothetical protein
VLEQRHAATHAGSSQNALKNAFFLPKQIDANVMQKKKKCLSSMVARRPRMTGICP